MAMTAMTSFPEEDRDCCYDYDTGHDGLQYFRPAEFLPQVPLPVARRVGLADLVLVGHGVPRLLTICTYCPVRPVETGRKVR
jgi:hypothetical protein